ncbi:MAG TPA: phosphate ABC transporter ATP-binding protein, partial [Gemmatimonadaceae bacterium]|nr:phosphate ABC transporter ATP-binding protein [Gemmatimonadaceae bacterium]
MTELAAERPIPDARAAAAAADNHIPDAGVERSLTKVFVDDIHPPAAPDQPRQVAILSDGLSAYFGDVAAVKAVSMPFYANEVTAIIGPSGCGKSTLLRCLNRMHETTPIARVEGHVALFGHPVYGPDVNATAVRRNVGMVFQRPTPFPTMSIRKNVIAGLTGPAQRKMTRSESENLVQETLRRSGLWDEVKDRLDDNPMGLSGGQQQRLCIARALATSPRVLLLDEPTASLDPLSTQIVEELVYELRQAVTVVIVTHNMQQAARVSDRTAFMLDGELIEVDATRKMFTTPSDSRTESY